MHVFGHSAAAAAKPGIGLFTFNDPSIRWSRMATVVPVRVVGRGFGRTARQDAWWVQPLVVFLGLSTFLCYATWAAFQGNNYTFGPYLSPFYSPEIFGDSPHSWFGPKPSAWPAWLPFSPALLILPIPAFF